MRRLLLTTLLSVTAGCPASDEPPTDDSDVDSDGDSDTTSSFDPVKAVFARNCTTSGCHAAPGEATTGLDLAPRAAWANLVDVDSHEQPGLKRVAPGDLDGSWLWHKINGTMSDVDPTDDSEAMPPPFGLGDQDIAVIRAWIKDGAPK